MSLTSISYGNPDWLRTVLEALDVEGCAVVTEVLTPAECDGLENALLDAQKKIVAEIGRERLERAGEMGMVRNAMGMNRAFIDIIAHPAILAVVDSFLSNTAILNLQNGLLLPSFPGDEAPRLFQNTFHMDFRRVLNGYKMAVNCMLTISPYTAENGGTMVIPRSHQRLEPPTEDMLRNAVSVICPAGSMLVFDGTLWHAAGRNHSGRTRFAINHQYSRAWVKQQMDYCRALGDDVVKRLPDRIQQLLGYWTRVPVTLDDYYKPAAERLYRAGQG